MFWTCTEDANNEATRHEKIRKTTEEVHGCGEGGRKKG